MLNTCIVQKFGKNEFLLKPHNALLSVKLMSNLRWSCLLCFDCALAILTLYLIETPFNTFSIQIRSPVGSSPFAYGITIMRYDPAQVDLTSCFSALCTNVKVFYIIIHSGWSLA